MQASPLQIRTDSCHGRPAVGVRARIDALQRRACDRADPELAIIRLRDPAQLLSAIFGADAQYDRFGRNQCNKCIHVYPHEIVIKACAQAPQITVVEQSGRSPEPVKRLCGTIFGILLWK